MKVLILYLEGSIARLMQEILREEGYDVVVTRHATEALRIIEGSAHNYVLLADNFHVSSEAFELFSMLRKRPSVRSRVRIISLSAIPVSVPEQWIADGLMDDRMPLPVFYMNLLDRVAANFAEFADG